jgi:hypothetical protein
MFSNVAFSLTFFVSFSPSATFWSYLVIRTVLGVLTAASLMMFEGAVMATIQVGNLGRHDRHSG